jgi:hypothetical protein
MCQVFQKDESFAVLGQAVASRTGNSAAFVVACALVVAVTGHSSYRWLTNRRPCAEERRPRPHQSDACENAVDGIKK